MVIELTPREEISLEYDIETVKSTPDDVLNIDKSFNFQAAIKNKTQILFKITYYIIFVDTRSNNQLLHGILDFGCRITKDGTDFHSDIGQFHIVLESICGDYWKSLQDRIPYLNQIRLIHPYVGSQFLEKMMMVLKENDFYE